MLSINSDIGLIVDSLPKSFSTIDAESTSPIRVLRQGGLMADWTWTTILMR